MKISKSKQELAQLLIEMGVTKFPDGANWAAQDKSGKEIYCYKNKPRRPLSWGSWHHDGGVVSNGEFQANALIANWHQTVLSSDEFDQIVAEIVAETAPDADGWIEWKGWECPAGEGDRIDVKFSDGDVFFDVGSDLGWGVDAGGCNIIAYRLHKPEQAKPECCESVMRSIPDPDEQVWTNPPSIEQLAADYRAKLAIATQAQEEADSHRCGAEVALSKLEIAAEDLGFKIEPITTKQDGL